jgi:flagellar biosynthesis/type III secretory pathway protein FliH
LEVSIARLEVERTYTQADLDRAYEQGRDFGRQAAIEEGEGALRDSRNLLLEVRNGILNSICERFDGALSQIHSLLPDLVCLATERVLGGCKIDGRMVLSIVNDLLAEFSAGEERLQVRLCGDDFESLQGLDGEIRARFPMIEFHVDPELRRGDCVVSTRFGLVDGRIGTKLKELGRQMS